MTSTDLVPVNQQSSFDLLPQAHELATAIAKTEFVPKALRNRPEAVMAAVLTGHEVGIGPMQSLSKIHVIEGRPAMSAELMRALVLAHGHELWVEEKSSTKVTVCGRRKDSDHVTRITWTMDDAKRANLASKNTWRFYPRAMLMARASAELVRDVFPEVLGGISYAKEEVEDGFVFDAEAVDAEPVAEPETVKRKAKPARKAAARKATAAPAGRSAPPMPPLPGEDKALAPDGDDDVIEAEIVEDTPGQPDGFEPMTDAQSRALHVLLKKKHDAAGDDRFPVLSAELGREVTSTKEISKAEASSLIDSLQAIR